MTRAHTIRIRGVVQGVGFRPYVFRLARAHALSGWVLNGGNGVEIHVEGPEASLEAFVRALPAQAPPAARIADLEIAAAVPQAFTAFEIRGSHEAARPTARISPDLPVCDACVRELFDAADRRRGYPYVNCTNCGPRYSIVRALPYDRARTTMTDWPMCPACAAEYEDPGDRRFHAQPTACPACGPRYYLAIAAGTDSGAEVRAWRRSDDRPIESAAQMLRAGRIVAVKGIGGYHLACDADAAEAVAALRSRKFRKDKAFAVMVRDADAARRTVRLAADAAVLLASPARPIVLAPALEPLPGVAPDNRDLGVMLPYTPVHHLLYAAGAPDRLVMTSGNRSSEPIAYRDDEALERLDGLADAVLTGERPIARRLDDSVVRSGALGPVVLRRSRGLAPGAVARLPAVGPVLAVGADLKNTVTLVVDGQAYVSQHVGDLDQFDAFEAFRETIRDLVGMYQVEWSSITVVHDLHPHYRSTVHAAGLANRNLRSVQHHRAHVASVLAEREALGQRVVGISFDGTGYGDDGSIWGGEFFVGSAAAGFERAAHLRPALLPGGDAAARHPVQAAAGFLPGVSTVSGLDRPPFGFPDRYRLACALAAKGVRAFETTSAGRLFDTVAALLGFTRATTFEGQAAMWVEHLARGATGKPTCPFVFDGTELDWRPALAAVADARRAGWAVEEIARAFHQGLARGIADAAVALLDAHGLDTIAVSGGVFQNDLLLHEILRALPAAVRVWANREVPPNDGGISLGQAALAATAMAD